MKRHGKEKMYMPSEKVRFFSINVSLGSMRWFTMAGGVPGLLPHVDLGRISMQLDDMKALLWAKISEMG